VSASQLIIIRLRENSHSVWSFLRVLQRDVVAFYGYVRVDISLSE